VKLSHGSMKCLDSGLRYVSTVPDAGTRSPVTQTWQSCRRLIYPLIFHINNHWNNT